MKLAYITSCALTAAPSVRAAPTPNQLALQMLDSIKARGQATLSNTGGTGLIQIGIFWQALATVSDLGPTSKRKEALRPLLYESLASTIPVISNATHDAALPLDRFSLGADMLAWQLGTGNTSFLSVIEALDDSLTLQPRNTDGGLWYYNNLDNLAAYQNLSYLDGMFSYAPYVVLHSQLANCSGTATALDLALEQLQLLHDICIKPSGLLVHGYDAIKAHVWANALSGASPEVWGRSLAWYSLGLLNTLEAAALSPNMTLTRPYVKLRLLFQEVMLAQLQAARRSKFITGRPGVWQVVDRPGESGNYIEASSSYMTAYTMLRGSRLNLLQDAAINDRCAEEDLRSYTTVAGDIYNTVSQQYLIAHHNGSLSMNGTSSIASLSGQNVSYEYYVSRPTEMDSLLGTSAFVLASHEMARL